MNFINETQHPKAQALFSVLRRAANYDAAGVPDFYQPLVEFKQDNDLTDEKAADLYARVEEGLSGRFHDLPQVDLTTKLSLFLWQNDRVYPQ